MVDKESVPVEEDIEVPPHIRRNAFGLSSELATLRAEQPVKRLMLPTGALAWIVTRYEYVREVLSDPERFGSDGTLPDPSGRVDVMATGAPARHGDLTTYDPPEHGRLRRMIAPAFSTRRVESLRPQVEETVERILKTMEHAGSPADFVKAFALPVPAMVTCELLGVSYEDRAEFNEHNVVRFDGTRDRATRMAAARASLAYMTRLVPRLRVDPDEGVLGMLVREHGSEIDDRELAGVGDLLLLGGFETTVNMLSLGTLLLLLNPEHAAAMRADEGTGDIIEEMLRYLSVVQTGVPRVARTDTVLAGQSIRRGSGCCALFLQQTTTKRSAQMVTASTLRAGSGHISPLAMESTTA